MFDVTVTNNYVRGFTIDGGNQIFAPGQTYQFPHWSGNHVISVWGMGDISFFDLGQNKLDAYTNPAIPWTKSTWGGVLRYKGLDAYFRYEGTGHVTITIDKIGSVTLHFDQGGMMVNLEDLRVVQS